MTRLTAGWIKHPATQNVFSALSREGALVLFVGGCVRNTLLNTEVSDIDLATVALPEEVTRLAGAAGIKVVPTGIDHGTVTLVADGIAHEVTTFREDVSTDGRRAVVSFSKDVAHDAARRDFTMNALYAHSDGTVLDPLNGLPDLQARRVRFIGNAVDRIREDYLRSLRYFRFHAWYGDQSSGFDPEALSAISTNLDGLEKLSSERVGTEMLKLLAAPNPAPSIAAMRSTGVLGQVLPGADDRSLAPLVHLEGQAGVTPDPIRRLAVLGGVHVNESLRLSRAQNTRLKTLCQAATGTKGAAELGYRLTTGPAMDVILLRCALLEQPWVPDAKADIMKGANSVFPVEAKDLMSNFQGAALGAELARLEAIWIASGFSLGRDDLLGR